jgi:hypothetical protein
MSVNMLLETTTKMADESTRESWIKVKGCGVIYFLHEKSHTQTQIYHESTATYGNML